MADLSLPSAVSLLQERIERRKAEGQRFPRPANSEEAFRSARFAPNEQVRKSVKAAGATRKQEAATETKREKERDKSPPKKRNNESFSSLPEETLREDTWKGRAGKDTNNAFRIGIPQRVEPPKDLNVPVRKDDGTMVAESEGGGGGGGGGGGAVAHGDPSVNRRQASQTKIKDQEMLAFACRRANKPRNEALAYYNMGVLLDNDKELEKANACYEQYLQASRAVGDAKGEQLALNSMAINMFKLGRYEEAIDLSNQHLQIADVAGKFVAHCNLGLAYAAMDELEQSSLNHRQALRWAQVGEQAEAEHRQVRDRDVECGRGESGVREPGERGGEEGRHADEQGVHGATPEALERPEGLQGAAGRKPTAGEDGERGGAVRGGVELLREREEDRAGAGRLAGGTGVQV